MTVLETIINNEYARFLIIIVGTLVVIGLSYFTLKMLIKRIAGRKKSYGDFILKQLSKPVFSLIFFVGLYLASKSLSILIRHSVLIDGAFFVVITLIVSLLVSRILNVFMGSWLKVRKGLERTPQLLSKVVSVIIFLIALIVILGYFKIDITALVAGVGLGALAIGLALQSTLSNFFAGLHLVSDKPIKVGDFIEIEDKITGTVEDIGWRSTRIRTLTDNLVIVPNGKLAESKIINYSLPGQEMAIWMTVGVAYESDLKKVEKVTLDVAHKIQQTTPGAVKTFEPLIRYKNFAESNIEFSVILRVEKPIDQYIVKHEFIKALKERYNKEDIEISWPIRKIYNMK